MSRQTINKPLRLIISFVVCIFLAKGSVALEAPSDDSLFYYKIGGGRDIAIPPSLNITTIDLSLSCLLYTSPSPRDQRGSRMPSSA